METLKYNPAAVSSLPSNVSSLSSRDRKALILKCQIALFSAYRIDQYADAEGFKNSLGAVLEGFPDEVICYVCDPRTGLQRRLKWPPTVNEIVEACEDHEEYLRKMRTARPAERNVEWCYQKPEAKPLKVFVATDHPGYAKAISATGCEAYTSPDGREGALVPGEILIELGLMKRGAA